MKKIHIQYRSGLLMGLLSLSILSSCVNARRELGMDASSSCSRQMEQDDSSQSNTRQEQGMDHTSGLQVEQDDNRDNLQAARRFNWIVTPVQSIVTSLLSMQPEELLGRMPYLVLGYYVGYYVGDALGYTAGCPTRSSNTYPGFDEL